MIIVEAVFDQQLPVSADVVLLRTGYHFHFTRRRLVDDEIDVFLRAGEVVIQWHSAGIEIEKHEAAITCYARRLFQCEFGTVEIRRIRILAGQSVECAIAVVGPAVIEAGEMFRIAFGFAANDSAAMAAGVEVHANGVAAVAAENHRPAAHRTGFEVARCVHF